ncbi:hypothetical protein [Marispirochaeta aestuarii]|uniref:hypothetical protein n=1 Tax=Marispirochaeta aestuarii TaxID=1963862 RepID=UPI0029C9A9F1|nr:hypothetical protein [Marispirochaeta aestuarii]
MFENILDQEHVISRLMEDLDNQRLPSSLLFFGPSFSGKLSAALELARGLSCSREREWSCSCPDCRKHRTLTHPDLGMLGPRYFQQELDGSLEVLRRSRKDFARYLVIRGARKLTRRFDPWLWEGEESRLKGARSSLDALEELLDELDPAAGELAETRAEKIISSIAKEAASVLKASNLSHIPIFMVRNLAYWARTTGHGKAKIIIMENAESMMDSARNAVLKILEEPPEGVHFILTTSKRAALIPTILSRVRPYAFKERDSRGERQVLDRIFREPSGEFRSLREYFLGFDLGAGEIRRHAETVADLALGNDSQGDLSEVFNMLQKKERFLPLLEEVQEILRLRLREGLPGVDLARMENLLDRLIQARKMFEGYNQNPDLLLEGLLYGGVR